MYQTPQKGTNSHYPQIVMVNSKPLFLVKLWCLLIKVCHSTLSHVNLLLQRNFTFQIVLPFLKAWNFGCDRIAA